MRTMMTDPTHLEDALHRLRTEIEALPLHDDESRRRLETLVGEIESTLADPQTLGADRSLGDRLKASVVGFEASHPRLATLLNDVVEKLGNIGI